MLRLTDEPAEGSSAVMNDTPQPPQNDASQNDAPKENVRELARRKLIGRAMVIGFLVLVTVYAVVTFMGRR